MNFFEETMMMAAAEILRLRRELDELHASRADLLTDLGIWQQRARLAEGELKRVREAEAMKFYVNAYADSEGRKIRDLYGNPVWERRKMTDKDDR